MEEEVLVFLVFLKVKAELQILEVVVVEVTTLHQEAPEVQV